jgi:hypothetical protein
VNFLLMQPCRGFYLSFDTGHLAAGIVKENCDPFPGSDSTQMVP